MSKLFSSYTIRDCELKNRVVMSPMCMYSAQDDGKVTPFHELHYASRAMGGVGLIIMEATAISKEGRISEQDLGIWDHSHVEGLRKLANQVHAYGGKLGMQLSHAGRKSRIKSELVGPSAIPMTEDRRVPRELTIPEIEKIVKDFKQAAVHANDAELDVLELHGAHGYLIHQFLSPVSNTRTDMYGGDLEGRSLFLRKIVEVIREVWTKPLFVRIAASEYDDKGNSTEDYIALIQDLKGLGVDLIDCSSGGAIPRPVKIYPGYQTYLSEKIRTNGEVSTGAVGLITAARTAEMILQNEAADLIFIGRELLRNPYWAQQAALELGESIDAPKQYERAWKTSVLV